MDGKNDKLWRSAAVFWKYLSIGVQLGPPFHLVGQSLLENVQPYMHDFLGPRTCLLFIQVYLMNAQLGLKFATETLRYSCKMIVHIWNVLYVKPL